MSKQVLIDQLLEKLKHLSETVWEHKLSMHDIRNWLDQFDTTEELLDDCRLHALYLLSNFTYFGQREIRALLVSLFRDLYRTPLVHAVRRANANTKDVAFLDGEFDKELARTRFLGVGNPSESGHHLLYYFRQENSLSKRAFINAHEIFVSEVSGSGSTLRLRNPDIVHYVFLDDLCGSGTQAELYSQDLVLPLKALKPEARVHYLVLFATETGLDAVRALGRYDRVDSLYVLDASFKALEPTSRIFPAGTAGKFDRLKVRATCERYGQILWPAHPLGYKDGQLLLGFNHNTPDNTLPLFWREAGPPDPWAPIFKRYHKIYA